MTPLNTFKRVYMHGSKILYSFDVVIFSLQFLMSYWLAHIVNDLSFIDGVLIGLMVAIASFSFLKLVQYVFFFFKGACVGRVFSIQTAIMLFFPAWISCSIAVLCYADHDEYFALMSLVTVFFIVSSIISSLMRIWCRRLVCRPRGWLFSRFWEPSNH